MSWSSSHSQLLLFATVAAGAQTVTLGTTTSSTSGNTTTITLPVTVAVPAATTSAPAPAMNSLRVEAGTGYGLSTNQTAGNSFKTLKLNSVVTDTASGWNAAANTYTVPVTGTYLIVSGLRLADNVAPWHQLRAGRPHLQRRQPGVSLDDHSRKPQRHDQHPHHAALRRADRHLLRLR